MPDKEESNVRRLTDLEGLPHDQLMHVHNAEFVRNNRRIADLEELSEKGIAEVASINKSIEFILKQQDHIITQTEAVIGLGKSVEHMVTAVEKLSTEVSKMVLTINDHEHRLSGVEEGSFAADIKTLQDKMIVLEQRPAKKVMEYLDKALSYLLVTGLAFALLAIGYYIKNK